MAYECIMPHVWRLFKQMKGSNKCFKRPESSRQFLRTPDPCRGAIVAEEHVPSNRRGLDGSRSIMIMSIGIVMYMTKMIRQTRHSGLSHGLCCCCPRQ